MTLAHDQSREKGVRSALLWVLYGNVAVAAAKLVYGYWTGSLSMRADGFHSLADSTSNIVGLIGITLAAKPADEEHPYGHQKFEMITSWLIGAMILLGMFKMVSEIFKGGDGPLFREVGAGGFSVAIGTFIINGLVAAWERKMGTELKSPILLADARHTASDMLATVGVFGSFVAVRMGYYQMDKIVASMIVLMIGWVALGIFKKGAAVLVDKSQLDASEVTKTALSVPGVLDCHRVRSRGIEGWVAVDFHILLDGKITLEESHHITHLVEEAVRNRFPDVVDVVIHTEPESSGHEPHPWEKPAT